MEDRKKDRIQLIVIENELGDYKRFSVSKKGLLIASGLFTAALSMLLFFTYSFFSILPSLKESRKRTEELKKRLALLEKQNEELRGQVSLLRKKQKETVEELAKRIEIIDTLMKRVGLLKEGSGEGGLAIPLESILTSEEVDFDSLVGSIDGYIIKLKSVPIGYPTVGRETSPFGLRRNPITGRLEFHLGVDIANHWGTPIRVTGDGTVIKAGWCGLLGKCVEVKHKDGIRTFYGHLARVLVRKGEKVTRGEIIGIMGNSGRSTGPHLHYAIKVGRKFVNPEIFMEAPYHVKEKRGK